MRKVFVGFLFLASVMTAMAQTTDQLDVMPLPTRYQMGGGRLLIDQGFTVNVTGYKEPRIDGAVQRFMTQLSRQTGMPFGPAAGGMSGRAILVVHTGRAGKRVQELGEDESYVLEVSESGAKLEAPTPLGTLHGLQTFLQLVKNTPAGFAAPVVRIEDSPRFPWRGLLIDVARHFMPLEVLRRNLDGLEAAKMNVLHLHLSENQGFRVESKRLPKLHEMGSDGLYYTQGEIADLIAYAHDRGIRVIPEFDMPGHATAWFLGYPELAGGAGPYTIERRWGIFDPAMDPTNENTYQFLDKVIGEMAGLFPDQYFHIGGDEVNGKQWDANKAVQDFIHAKGLKSNEELQSYFSKRVQEIVQKHGKIMVGWDEVLQPDSPKSIVIQSWRGPKSLAAAAKQGNRGLLSSGYYLDLQWPTVRHYMVDPMGESAAGLSEEEKRRIVGGEACMWSEYVSPENIDSRIWPRAAAIAERLWSPAEAKDVDSMYRRMGLISQRLDNLGLTHNSNYEPMLRRIAGGDESALPGLRTLADVVEPVKEYRRGSIHEGSPYTSATPLNRLIDAARPESETARRFAARVDALISGKANSADDKRAIRESLTQWRDNDARLQPHIKDSFLMQEVSTVSRSLSEAAAAGLQAMDHLERGTRPPADWVQQQAAVLQEAQKPHAEVLIMVAPSIKRLVDASAGVPVTPGAVQ